MLITGTVDCESVTILPTIQKLPEKPEENLSQTIFAISPTYTRLTQLLDLTSLCQTLMNVNNLIWVVVENAKTDQVAEFLDRCTVKSIHISLRTLKQRISRIKFPMQQERRRSHSRNFIAEHNKGLEWIRTYCSTANNCTGVVYFLSDENKYDLRLFQQVQYMENRSYSRLLCTCYGVML